MFACGQVLTDVLVFTFTPLYPAYRGAYGLSALTDQQLAGVVMMVEQLLTLGTLAFAAASRPQPRHAARHSVSATSFSFEPAFLALAVAAAAALRRGPRATIARRRGACRLSGSASS